MMWRALRDGAANRRAGWLAAGAAAILGAATVLLRRSYLEQLRAAVGGRYGEASGRGRPKTPPSPRAREAGHETRDMRGGLMAKLVVLLGSVALVMVFAMVGLRYWIATAQRDSVPPLTRQQTVIITPPGPHLQRAPLTEIANQQAREDQALDSYAYVDDAHTRARIPIDRALSLTVGQPLAPPP
ncbi:MAG: hypothetical protein RQ966_03940 [Acetobacteraceae bacterium]|nr:hypothetical protein [Acetobacteraceae bacterium]